MLETANPDSASRIASGAKFSKARTTPKRKTPDTRTPNQVLADMGRGPMRIQTAADGSLVETRNIPTPVAQVYADMFGLNPQTLSDKSRNFQKTDADGKMLQSVF